MTPVKSSKHAKVFGFSLTELMIVIVIVSILAAIAVPIYARYIRKSRTSEAISNLGTIAMFQETYFSEADSYVTTGPSPASVPNSSHQGGRLGFDNTASNWSLLGRVIPNGTPLYFQYEVRAGQQDSGGSSRVNSILVGSTTAAVPGRGHCSKNTWNSSGYAATDLGLNLDDNSNWFYATAVGDQKGGSGGRGRGFCSLFVKVIDRPDIVVQNDIE